MDEQTKEALKMSIEAMYDAGFFIDGDVGYPIFFEKSIKACEKALAEAEKQEWQSLSDDEMKIIQNNSWIINADGSKEFNTFVFARAIEQASRKKNETNN